MREQRAKFEGDFYYFFVLLSIMSLYEKNYAAERIEKNLKVSIYVNVLLMDGCGGGASAAVEIARK